MSRQGVNADTVRRAQAAVAAGQSLSAFALANNVSLNSLRSALHADGSLVASRAQQPGIRLQPVNAEIVRWAQAAVAAGQLLAGGVQGGRLKGANAEVIRQARDAIATGRTLEAFARANDISPNSLRHCVHVNGTLTLLGAQVVAGGVRSGQLKGATAEIVRRAQAAIAGGRTRAEFAAENNVALSSLKSVVRNDGTLTQRGVRLLARDQGQP